MTERSPLDWHSAPLEPSTRIDAAYRNTQNVRRFFTREIGEHFRFDRPFMAWMKSHRGSTLAEAAEQWRRHRQDDSQGSAENDA
ncbi:DUF6434 domain-containing protein [Hoeflea marina]|nr:DUF6434 domain-containing protein [Hoeflea marina]